MLTPLEAADRDESEKTCVRDLPHVWVGREDLGDTVRVRCSECGAVRVVEKLPKRSTW